jgi:hypothetical protein
MADDLQLHYEPFNARLVYMVDHIVEIAKKNGSKEYVQTSHDWDTVREIFSIWSKLFPKHYENFAQSIREFRSTENAHGIGKGKGGAVIQHNLEVPEMFHNMVKIIFPDQKWDTRFAHQLAKEVPILKPIADSY